MPATKAMTKQSSKEVRKLLKFGEDRQYQELARSYLATFRSTGGLSKFVSECGSVASAIEILKINASTK